MNEPAPRRQFTLLQLLAVVTILCGLLAVGAMFVSREIASMRRTRCSSNLRQWGIAAHNYHDVHNEMPPLASADGGWSWVAYVAPYCGAVSPSAPDARTQLNPAAPANRRWVVGWDGGPSAFCPSRRSQGVRNGGTYAGGSPTDYVGVSTSTTNQWSSTSDGMFVLCKQPPTAPIASATTFLSVTDGTSNTAMIGEKHMRPSWFGGPLDEPALIAVKGPNTVRLATDQAGIHRLAEPNSSDRQAFGGPHPGVTLFGKGDASVTPLKNTAAPQILRSFTSRNDGQPFEFP